MDDATQIQILFWFTMLVCGGCVAYIAYAFIRAALSPPKPWMYKPVNWPKSTADRETE